jgi:hypothetical protein
MLPCTVYGDGWARFQPEVGTRSSIGYEQSNIAIQVRDCELADEDRIRLSFEQAEGVEPLPSQLQLREVSTELRAVLWHTIQSYLAASTARSDYGKPYL